MDPIENIKYLVDEVIESQGASRKSNALSLTFQLGRYIAENNQDVVRELCSRIQSAGFAYDQLSLDWNNPDFLKGLMWGLRQLSNECAESRAGLVSKEKFRETLRLPNEAFVLSALFLQPQSWQDLARITQLSPQVLDPILTEMLDHQLVEYVDYLGSHEYQLTPLGIGAYYKNDGPNSPGPVLQEKDSIADKTNGTYTHLSKTSHMNLITS